MKTYVLVCCDVGTEDYVISSLKKIETVKNAQSIFGIYDIVIELESNDEQKIQQNITKSIRKIPKICSTMTLTNRRESIINNTDHEKKVIQKEKFEQAYVIIHFDKSTFAGNEKNVLQELLKIPEIVECDILIESYKAICKLAASTYSDISQIVTKKIRHIKNIHSTVTLNVISE